MDSKHGQKKNTKSTLPKKAGAPQSSQVSFAKAQANQFPSASKKLRHQPTLEAQAETPTDRAAFEEALRGLGEAAKEFHSTDENVKRKRKAEPPPRLARDQPLSESELRAIRARRAPSHEPTDDPARYWIENPPGPQTYGQLASFPEAQLLAWIDSVESCIVNGAMNPDNCIEPPSSFKQHVFDWFAGKVMANDAGFFAKLGFLLQARRERRRLSEISPQELGYKQLRGRKAKTYDLALCVEAAVSDVLAYRNGMLPEDGEGPFELPGNGDWPRLFRITREELQHAIRRRREWAGMGSSTPISDFELSRWITKTGIRPFMARKTCAKTS